jgi:GNAT superfamily N-acetyltransferase
MTSADYLKGKEHFERQWAEAQKIDDSGYRLEHDLDKHEIRAVLHHGTTVGVLDYAKMYRGIFVILLQVDCNFRRNGIGSKLLQALLGSYPDMDVELEAVPIGEKRHRVSLGTLLDFYGRHGFGVCNPKSDKLYMIRRAHHSAL